MNNQLEKKEEELAMATSDKVRFKELSEGYMQEVARLEAQLSPQKPPQGSGNQVDQNG